MPPVPPGPLPAPGVPGVGAMAGAAAIWSGSSPDVGAVALVTSLVDGGEASWCFAGLGFCRGGVGGASSATACAVGLAGVGGSGCGGVGEAAACASGSTGAALAVGGASS